MKLQRSPMGWIVGLAIFAGMLHFSAEIAGGGWRGSAWPIRDTPGLGRSVAFLLSVFAIRVCIWRFVLRRYHGPFTWAAAIESRLRPVLAKYAPGKIWALVSTVGYLERQGIGRASAAVITTWFQAVQMLSGVAIGTIGLATAGGASSGLAPYWPAAVATTALIALGLYLGGPLLRYATRRLGSGLPSPHIDGTTATAAIIFSVLAWLVLALAYREFFLACGLDVPAEFILVMPLANVLGMLAVLTPGGLGVRESALGLVLSGFGVPPAHAAATAVWSRLWFMGGELSAFLAGNAAALYSRFKRKRPG